MGTYLGLGGYINHFPGEFMQVFLTNDGPYTFLGAFVPDKDYKVTRHTLLAKHGTDSPSEDEQAAQELLATQFKGTKHQHRDRYNVPLTELPEHLRPPEGTKYHVYKAFEVSSTNARLLIDKALTDRETMTVASAIREALLTKTVTDVAGKIKEFKAPTQDQVSLLRDKLQGLAKEVSSLLHFFSTTHSLNLLCALNAFAFRYSNKDTTQDLIQERIKAFLDSLGNLTSSNIETHIWQTY
jgi:hypothetical protein